MPNRILGELRIFQAVLANLEYSFERKSNGDAVYTFTGGDPFMYEDDNFAVFKDTLEKKMTEDTIKALDELLRFNREMVKAHATFMLDLEKVTVSIEAEKTKLLKKVKQ